MVEAFRAEGLKVGFYHSLIDWHHPEFPIDGLHSMRDNEEFKAANKNRDVRKLRRVSAQPGRGAIDELRQDRLPFL